MPGPVTTMIEITASFRAFHRSIEPRSARVDAADSPRRNFWRDDRRGDRVHDGSDRCTAKWWDRTTRSASTFAAQEREVDDDAESVEQRHYANQKKV